MKKEKKQNEFEQKRKELVQSIVSRGILLSPFIIQAFLRIPREKFVKKEYQKEAYADHALPFALGQTISQPSTIAIMLEFLEIKPGQKVLEVGSGCGYVLALLSHIVGKKGNVFGVEIEKKSVDTSRKMLQELNSQNVEILCRDGKKGWKEKSPFDGILVSAACPKIPEMLIEQLAENGKMVIPMGNSYSQELVCLTKQKGKIHTETYSEGNFVFVPLHD